ncbi:MAG: hypothetical protein JWP06_492 [Candidatus Saccharibacteria bacterium]|nr:hypothetical protein [Candidatus Saccharibacteria bacterium]
MRWFRCWLRRRVLLRRLKSSDARYDVLSARRDQLNALDVLLGGNAAVTEIKELYILLDEQDALCEKDYVPIEDELELLESSSISRWLLYRSVDIVTVVAAGVVVIVRTIRRLIRRTRSRMRRQSKMPAHPNSDESSGTLLSRMCGLDYVFIFSSL